MSTSETWRQCVERLSSRYGLEDECLANFDTYIELGVPEDKAAFDALYDWDCTDYDQNTGNLFVRKLP